MWDYFFPFVALAFIVFIFWFIYVCCRDFGTGKKK